MRNAWRAAGLFLRSEYRSARDRRNVERSMIRKRVQVGLNSIKAKITEDGKFETKASIVRRRQGWPGDVRRRRPHHKLSRRQHHHLRADTLAVAEFLAWSQFFGLRRSGLEDRKTGTDNRYQPNDISHWCAFTGVVSLAYCS